MAGVDPFQLFPASVEHLQSTMDTERQNGLRCDRCGYLFQHDSEKETPPDAKGARRRRRVCRERVECVIRSTQARNSGE